VSVNAKSLNIKDGETHRMAQELARLTGRSMTAAVNEALREQLERVRRKPKKDMAEQIMEIARDCGKRWKEPYKSMDIDDLLYDEKGLPK